MTDHFHQMINVAMQRAGKKPGDMCKIAVPIDTYKVEFFETQLPLHNFEVKNLGMLTPGVIVLRVDTTEPYRLATVLQALDTKVKKRKAEEN